MANELTQKEIEELVDEKFKTFKKEVNKAAEQVENLPHNFQWLEGFIRRMTSREFIAVAAALGTIISGAVDTEQALAVAVAAGGLAVGRGVAKGGPGKNDN